MDNKTCGHCGTVNDMDSSFCRKCGSPLKGWSTLDIESQAVSKNYQAKFYMPGVTYEGKTSIGSGWITFLKVCAWMVFAATLIGGLVGACYISQSRNDCVTSDLILAGTLIVALFFLARVMVSLDTSENIASMTDNTSEILKFLVEENNNRIGDE
jgi:hypothetical protein